MRALVLVAAGVLLAACGGSDARPGPRVDLIPEAIAATEAEYGGPQEYFEISAKLDGVSVIVAVDGATAAEQGGLSADGGLTVFELVGPASGVTFTADQIDLDPDQIFEQVRAELDDPTIIDLAIQGGPNGTLVYDATVAGENGGVLLVLLGPGGEIRAVQGQ